MKLDDLRRIIARGEGIPEPEPEPAPVEPPADERTLVDSDQLKIVMGVDHGSESSTAVVMSCHPDGTKHVLETIEAHRPMLASDADMLESLTRRAMDLLGKSGKIVVMGTPRAGKGVLLDRLREGRLEGVSMGGPIRGRHADTVIVDDPIGRDPFKSAEIDRWMKVWRADPAESELAARIARSVGMAFEEVIALFKKLKDAVKPVADSIDEIMKALIEVAPDIKGHDLRRARLRGEGKIFKPEPELRALSDAFGAQGLWKLWYNTDDLRGRSRQPIRTGDVLLLDIRVYNPRDHPEPPWLVGEGPDIAAMSVPIVWMPAGLVVDVGAHGARGQKTWIVAAPLSSTH